MKVIGGIEPTQDELCGIGEENEYLGGNIVILSRHEMGALKMLQDACGGLKNDYYHGLGKPKDATMDDLFMLVYRFAEAKFAINDFKSKIKDLENILESKKNDL